ncbi:MAG: type II toxin-antitoxin system RelE/ParE family toxin [Acidobacteriota bacterium]|nr:type II toxin-antitoxin system RelE/ParE family toxin [Acidobacteriota bacterium]
MIYTVIFKPSVAKQLRRINNKEQKKIVAAAENLASEPRPHGYKKLVGGEGFYRIVIGDYRIIYEIDDDVLIVSVLRVAKRNERTY